MVCDDERHDRLGKDETMEQLEDDELRLEEVVDEMPELINSMDEMEVKHTDNDDEDDGGDETEVYEIIVVMMIRMDEEEVDM